MPSKAGPLMIRLEGFMHEEARSCMFRAVMTKQMMRLWRGNMSMWLQGPNLMVPCGNGGENGIIKALKVQAWGCKADKVEEERSWKAGA